MLRKIKKITKFLKNLFKMILFIDKWNENPSMEKWPGDKLSIQIPWEYRKDRARPWYFSYMFLEDINLSIMPYISWRKQREKYSAIVEPLSNEKARILASALWDRGSMSLSDGLCDFIRETSAMIHLDWKVLYEIIYNKDKSDKIISLGFELIDNRYIFKLGNNYYQLVPWWIAKINRISVQIIKIPAHKVLAVEIPKQTCSFRKYRSLLKNLEKIDKTAHIPSFIVNDFQNKTTDFSLDLFSKYRYLEVAQLTKDFWWNQRDYNSKFITEYYSIFRMLINKRHQATIREEIMQKINNALNGPYLKFDIKISMTNLFSVNDVENEIKNLEKWNIKFSSLMEKLSLL